MKTAVIILNYNSEDDTIRYVNEIKDYNCLNTIVVVDNKSTNQNAFDSLKSLSSNKVYVIESDKNGGYSYGNNFGLKFLESLNQDYDYVIISNPDISIEENAISKCLEFLEKTEDAAVASPKMLDKDGNHIRRSSWKIRRPNIDMINSTRVNELLFYKWFKEGEYSEDDFKKSELPVECISGAFFIIKYKIFKDIGFFDENVFLFYEEDILGLKLKNLNLKEYSLNDITFKHFESRSISKAITYFNKIKRLQMSKMYFQKEYNKISKFQEIIFWILNYWRRFELMIEIPIRKLRGNQ